ncbi:hypothetical protein PV326_004607 [Microctonus aethiopoides]|nr:hypothetical protein PV326_004607 [Microctonus aethiopoides]
MSLCVTDKRQTIISATIMEIIGPDGHQNNPLNEINKVREMKGVETDPTPPTAMEETIAAQSADEEMELNCRLDNICTGKDRSRLLVKTSQKIESGSGSGDQEVGQPEDSADVAAKKRKTRRGKPKHRKLKPYSKQQLSRCRSTGRLIKKTAQPTAPYNTTQFLMEDHRTNLPSLDQTICRVANDKSYFQKPSAPSRTRDSSFSIDSDEDYFYSSPEDEEEFLTKEFSSAYEDYHAERLSALSKSDLIQEYIQLEAKVDALTKRLRCKNIEQNEETELNEMVGDNTSTTNSAINTDFTKKLKICQQRIDDLIQQNAQLIREIETLRDKERQSTVSSVDSESDSDSSSSSSSNHSCCSCSVDGDRSPDYKCTRHNADERVNGRVSTPSSTDANDYVNGNADPSEHLK